MKKAQGNERTLEARHTITTTVSENRTSTRLGGRRTFFDLQGFHKPLRVQKKRV